MSGYDLIDQMVTDARNHRFWKEKFIVMLGISDKPDQHFCHAKIKHFPEENEGFEYLNLEKNIKIFYGFDKNVGLIKELIGSINIIVIEDKEKALEAFKYDYGLRRRAFVVDLNDANKCEWPLPLEEVYMLRCW